MRFPLKAAALLYGLLACGAARAEQTACQRFKQQYAEQYVKIDCVDKDTAVVRNRQRQYALADSQNRLLVPFGTYAAIVTFNIFSQDGRLLLNVLSQDGKQGVIDSNGKTVLPPQYDGIVMPQQAEEPIIIVKNSEDGRRFGLTDQAGKLLLEPRYYGIGFFSEGLAVYIPQVLKKYGERNPHIRIGYLDTQGNTVIAPQFADAKPFGDGVAWVQQPDNGDWLLIDRTGKTLLRAPYTYQGFGNFDKNGLAWIEKNNLYGLINKRGESVLAAEYDDALYWDDGKKFYLLEKGGKFGAADAQGKVVVPTEFDAPTDWDKEETLQGQTALVRGLTVYLFDQNGKQIKQRPARYAQQCAHVAVGLPHKSKTNLLVRQVYTDQNTVLFTNADGNKIDDGKCSDVAVPRKKRRS